MYLDEILSFFGGRALPMMAQFAEAGKLSLDDVRELEKTLQELERRKRAETTPAEVPVIDHVERPTLDE